MDGSGEGFRFWLTSGEEVEGKEETRGPSCDLGSISAIRVIEALQQERQLNDCDGLMNL